MKERNNPSLENSRPPRAAVVVAALCLAWGVGVLGYRLLHTARLEQSAALFVGLPALLATVAAIIVLYSRAESATGIAVKAMTIVILLAGPLLNEGFVCVILGAPLLYLVAAVVGVLIDGINRVRRERQDRDKSASFGLLLLVVLFASSLEGTTPWLSLPRQASSTAERVVTGSPAEIEAALAAPPSFEKPMPGLLRIGFPTPTGVRGAGLQVGDTRTISFGRRSLVMRVDARTPTSVRFTAARDETVIAQWLTWQSAEVTWSDLGDGHTRVRWTLDYSRRLDPAWYFGPWEAVVTAQSAEYLIDSAATPIV